MGTWSRKLYGNDYASDVKGDCEEFLSYYRDGQKTLDALLEVYSRDFDDEEPLFWYAIADTFLKYGVLTPEIKQKALDWIDKEGGIELWEEANKADKWRQTLKELREGLTGEPPVPKKLPKYANENYWNIGEVYAIQINDDLWEYEIDYKTSWIRLIDDWNLNGKYFVVVKTGEYEEWSRIPGVYDKYPILRVYNKTFDSIPSIQELNDIPYMNFVYSNNRGDITLKREMVYVYGGEFRKAKKKFIKLGEIPIEKTDHERSWRIDEVAEELLGEKVPVKFSLEYDLFMDRAESKYNKVRVIDYASWGFDLGFTICLSYIFNNMSELSEEQQRKIKCLYLIDSWHYPVLLTRYYPLFENDDEMLVYLYDRISKYYEEWQLTTDKEKLEFLQREREKILEEQEEMRRWSEKIRNRRNRKKKKNKQ